MVFSIDPETTRLVAHLALGDEVEIFDCVADATCRNPCCRCLATAVALRPRTPGQPVREAVLDLEGRKLGETLRNSASADDLAFGERLLSAMDEADFDLLGRIHFAAKNRITEKAHPSEINARFDFDEVEGSSLVQAYNDILPFGDTFRVTIGGTDFVVLDQYCVKPRCGCTDAVLNLIPEGELGTKVASSGAVRVDCAAASWEPVSGEPLPCEMAELKRLMETESPDLYQRLRARHKRLRAIYAHCSRRQREARQAVMSPASVGRNDPCPCGSGKKYKKCCLGRTEGGMAVGVTPKAIETARTSTIFSATRTPRSS